MANPTNPTHTVIITDQAFEALRLIAEEHMSLEQAAYTLRIDPWQVNYHVRQTLYLIDQARRFGFRLARAQGQKEPKEPEDISCQHTALWQHTDLYP